MTDETRARLRDLAAAHQGARVHAFGANLDALSVSGIAYDSRQMRPGSLFAALRGSATDGLQFVEAAAKKGAVAVLADRAPLATIPWIEAKNSRAALADIAICFYGDPASGMKLAGVTGTNGKTTTAFLIDAGLRHAGHVTGLFGTIESRIASRPLPSVLTTPESVDLQRTLAEMKREGVSHVSMEVSSHALVQERVRGLRFHAAVFTNLTRDHLDFHGDMDSYWAAKERLFTERLHPEGVAILNVDDERGHSLATRLPRRKRLSFSFDPESDADIVPEARGRDLSLSGTSFSFRCPAGRFRIESPLVGDFNVRNLLGAFGALVALGVPPETAARGLGSLEGVPGRMERVDEGQPFTVLVDYAHTDDALRSALLTVRGLKPNRVVTVFGCGGDRDRSKRPLMGAVAAQHSDVVVATSDNPRSEPPESILEEIAQGFRNAASQTSLVVDRAEAIERALRAARPGDAVIIAGKGHETTQTLRTGKIPFDDRHVARGALRRLGFGRSRDQAAEAPQSR
jgi:UDP-N-acetylmuramoyl-L-alanyl-D-glutamate--2,6-diaminopimelate ligase